MKARLAINSGSMIRLFLLKFRAIYRENIKKNQHFFYIYYIDIEDI